MNTQFSNGVLDRARAMIKDLKIDKLDLRLSPVEQVDVFVPRYATTVEKRVEQMSIANKYAIIAGTDIGRREMLYGAFSEQERIEAASGTLIAAMITLCYQSRPMLVRSRDARNLADEIKKLCPGMSTLGFRFG